MIRRPAIRTLFPYTTLFRSYRFPCAEAWDLVWVFNGAAPLKTRSEEHTSDSSHANSSYAVLCWKTNSGRQMERERKGIPLAMGGVPAEVAARGTQAGRHGQR